VRSVEEFFERCGLTPRPGQVEVAEQLARMLDGSVGLEAPTGFGKTVVVLAALWSRELLPITWRVRTYAVARHIADECARCELRFFIAGGRERTCPLAREYGPALPWYCRYRRRECSYFSKLLERAKEAYSGGITAFSYEDLSAERGCPYYQQLLVKGVEVYIAAYNMGLELPAAVEVVDEAHNTVEVRCLPEAEVWEVLSPIMDELPESFEPSLVGELLEMQLARTHDLRLMKRAARVASLLKGVWAWREEGEVCVLKLLRPRAARVVFVSATLTPVAHLFNVPVVSVPARKREALVTTWLTTRYTDFDEKMMTSYNKLLFVLRKHCRRILLFATKRVLSVLNYDYGDEGVGEWLARGGVLGLLARGRRAEGVNLEADCVVLAGAVFLPPHVRVQKVGLSPEVIPAVTALQNVGRAARAPDARVQVVLADERFARIPMLRESFEMHEVHDIKELQEALQQQTARFSR